MVKAELKMENGAPALYINGKYTSPFLFWGRSVYDMRIPFIPDEGDIQRRISLILSEQRHAAKHGVHLISLFMVLDPNDHTASKMVLHKLVENDPECYIIPRILIPYDHKALDMPESENEKFSDGLYYDGGDKVEPDHIRSDFISPLYIEKSMGIIRDFIRAIKADPILSERVCGYHYSGGETGEWFQRRWWWGVMNVSDVNKRLFKAYLKEKYGLEPDIEEVFASLQHEFLEDKFQEKPFTDNPYFTYYSDYFSETVEEMIETAARVVKEETDGNSLFVTFYGYLFELFGANSGHWRLHKLLHCPDVDMISSPLSYQKRNEGEIGSFMSVTSSVTAHGKMWIDESDYRMPCETCFVNTVVPGAHYVSSMQAADEVIARECGKIALFGAGTWWMDLSARGWYDNDEIWTYIQKGIANYEEIRANMRDRSSDVIIVMDERAQALVQNTWQIGRELLYNLRSEVNASGLSCDYRFIEDFIDGEIDGAKLYVFLNPYRYVQNGIAKKVQAKLQQLGSAALWVFGFQPQEDKKTLRAMTGFDFDFTQETSDKVIFLDENTRIEEYRVPVEYLCEVKNGTRLGEYDNGKTAVAFVDNGYRSYFYGGTKVTAELLRALAKRENISIYTEAGDAFFKLGNVAVLHTCSAGEKTLQLGEGVWKEIRENQVYQGRIRFTSERAKTFIFIKQ